MGVADLHLHTTASDGTLTPTQVVEKAKKMGFKAIAITDHDTIDGIIEGIEAGKNMDIEVIPGIEFNTHVFGKEVHILGYLCDLKDQSFIGLMEYLKKIRRQRVTEIINKLRELGIDITLEEVIQGNLETTAIGRPHIAKGLVERGYVRSLREAFDKYLGMNGSAYVYRNKLTPHEAVKKIREAKGIPVLAHPFLVGDDNIINELMPAGLLGIEVYHTDHYPEQNEHYLRLAKKFNLLVTGGSDDHGTMFDHPLMGKVRLPYYYVEQLKKQKLSLGEKNGSSTED